MTYLIGADEAGYGPNLGPLVIAATLWRVPDGVDGAGLYELLPGVCPPGNGVDPDKTLCIGDSKHMYSAAKDLAGLERAVFAALAAAGKACPTAACATNWRELLTGCDPACVETLNTVPWYAGFGCSVPVDASEDTVASAHRILAGALEENCVELSAIRCRMIFPEEFNDRIQACGSKGRALSLWMLELVEPVLQSIEVGNVLLQSDKHGGRNRYGPLLQQVFPEHLIEVGEETRARSSYRWGPSGRRIAAEFVAKGDRLLPAALASMLAKYLRELAMRAFNTFWRQRVLQLQPTAGYPVDAKRFRRDIQSTQRELGISDRVLWRDR